MFANRWRQELGVAGETLACRELLRRGYEILARRYRTRYGELDIVARDRQVTVFVEVKARSSRRFGSPSEAVTPLKQRKLVMMARDYLARRRLGDIACRFDVVAITHESGRPPSVEVFCNAFELTDGDLL